MHTLSIVLINKSWLLLISRIYSSNIPSLMLLEFPVIWKNNELHWFNKLWIRDKFRKKGASLSMTNRTENEYSVYLYLYQNKSCCMFELVEHAVISTYNASKSSGPHSNSYKKSKHFLPNISLSYLCRHNINF